MSEKFIREVAERFGLEVMKRITTGNSRTHFATFELDGSPDRLSAALPVLREQAPPVASLTTGNVKDSPHYGKPYIEIQSVWCEMGD